MRTFCIYYRDRRGRDCKAVIRAGRVADAMRRFNRRYRQFLGVILSVKPV